VTKSVEDQGIRLERNQNLLEKKHYAERTGNARGALGTEPVDWLVGRVPAACEVCCRGRKRRYGGHQVGHKLGKKNARKDLSGHWGGGTEDGRKSREHELP